jgi:hypothetical protein
LLTVGTACLLAAVTVDCVFVHVIWHISSMRVLQCAALVLTAHLLLMLIVCFLYTQGAGYVPSTMEDVFNSAPNAEDSEASDDMLH